MPTTYVIVRTDGSRQWTTQSRAEAYLYAWLSDLTLDYAVFNAGGSGIPLIAVDLL